MERVCAPPLPSWHLRLRTSINGAIARMRRTSVIFRFVRSRFTLPDVPTRGRNIQPSGRPCRQTQPISTILRCCGSIPHGSRYCGPAASPAFKTKRSAMSAPFQHSAHLSFAEALHDLHILARLRGHTAIFQAALVHQVSADSQTERTG